jgi:hypothetical protein
VVNFQQLAGGATAYAVPVQLAQGAANHFLVTASDAAGSESVAGVVPTITENSTAPGAPTVDTPATPVTVNAGTYIITGSAEANALVRIYSDANKNGKLDAGDPLVASQQLAGASTAYAVTVSLAPGGNDFLVTARDAQSLESAITIVTTITRM